MDGRQPLEYARPAPAAAAAAGEAIVDVLPEGVVLRLTKPGVATETLKLLVYLAAAAPFGVVTGMAVWALLVARGARADTGSWFCGLFSLLFCVAILAEAMKPARTLLGLMRRDPRVGTRFFAAADQPRSADVDPVASLTLAREPLQWTLKRPWVVRITTARGKKFRLLLRNRPRDELERVADELRALLRLEAAPAKGFPVILPGNGDRA